MCEARGWVGGEDACSTDGCGALGLGCKGGGDDTMLHEKKLPQLHQLRGCHAEVRGAWSAVLHTDICTWEGWTQVDQKEAD